MSAGVAGASQPSGVSPPWKGKRMKIRNGFVSNSSSSSYIVLYKAPPSIQYFDVSFEFQHIMRNFFNVLGKTHLKLLIENLQKSPKLNAEAINKYEKFFEIASRKENEDKELLQINIDICNHLGEKLFNSLVKEGYIEILRKD